MFVSGIKIVKDWQILVFSFFLEVIIGLLFYINPIFALIPLLILFSLSIFYYSFLIGPLPWVFLMVIATGLDAWGRIIDGITLFHVGWVMSIITVVYSMLTSNIKIKIKFPINKYIIIYLLLATISLTYSPNQLSGALLILITISQFVLFILVANYIKTKRDFLIVIWSLLLSNIFNSLLTFYQIAFQNILYFGRAAVESSSGQKIWRAAGTFSDPNVLASFMFVGAILGASLILYSNLTKKHKFLIGFSVFLSIIGILATFSRSGWVSLFIGFMVLIIMHRKKIYFVYFVTFFVLLLLFFVLFTEYGGFLIERIISMFDIMKDISIRTRIGLAISSLKMFVDHPFLGVGFRGFPIYYDFYWSPITPSALLHVKESHTLYTLLLAELGVPGLLVIVLFFKRVIVDTLKKLKEIEDKFFKSVMIGNFAVFISFIITYFFYGNLFPDFNLIWINLGMLYAFTVRGEHK